MTQTTPTQEYVDLVKAVRTYFEVQDDLQSFDGDKRGIASALLDKENVVRKMVGLQEIENE
jgi:hypothetical protein